MLVHINHTIRRYIPGDLNLGTAARTSNLEQASSFVFNMRADARMHVLEPKLICTVNYVCRLQNIK
jgi:hypothetical protein